MNMLLCRPEKITRISPDKLRCIVDDARRIEHICNILKLKENDDCKVGVLNRGCCCGKVTEIAKDKVVIDFDTTRLRLVLKSVVYIVCRSLLCGFRCLLASF